jgi:ubiquinone/menaquinone biosynthesis C-methylase UbiE
MSKCNNDDIKHCRRGRSSERLLDKDEILKILNISKSQVVLDAGCGDGYMALEFSKLVKDSGKVYALDPDKNAIKEFQARLDRGNIEIFVGDITQETKLFSDSLDLIYLSTVVHCFSANQMQGFINEVKRLLKSGGRLAILEIKKETTPFGPPLEMRLSADDLKEAIPLTPQDSKDIGKYFYIQLFRK